MNEKEIKYEIEVRKFIKVQALELENRLGTKHSDAIREALAEAFKLGDNHGWQLRAEIEAPVHEAEYVSRGNPIDWKWVNDIDYVGNPMDFQWVSSNHTIHLTDDRDAKSKRN